MPVESLFPRLEPLLPSVSKPIQYVGGELNSQVKDWDACDVRWALMYPDAYEVGLPNQGVMILYEVLNEQPTTLAERTYAVWPDMAERMRAAGVPQFTVDGHRPVRDFDVLGISFSTELGYTNMLEALDLAGIPLHARDRDETHPIVLAGGHAAFNPEPIADFIDAAVLGDGEQAVLEMTAVIRQAKAEGVSREEVLLRLARAGGVYVPRFYDVEHLPDGRIARVAPNRPDVPFRVHKRTVMDLDEWPVPEAAAGAAGRDGARAHERRDLPRLHARLPLLPGRHDHPSGARAVAHRHRRDGPGRAGRHRLRGGRPAEPEQRRPLRDRRRREGPRRPLRGDADQPVPAQHPRRRLQHRPRPGAQPQRPPVRADLRARGRVGAAAQGHQQDGQQAGPRRHGDGRLRRGLAPGEAVLHGRPADRDRRGRARDRRDGPRGHPGRAQRHGQPRRPLHGEHRRLRPKPHTPFQWAGQLDHESTDRRLKLLRQAISSDRSTAKAIGYRYHDGKPGIVEGLLSRGDRRTGALLEQVWRDGARFDGWSEHFSYDRWMAAADEVGLDVAWYTTREREESEVLPWDHLDSGLDKEWLWSDWQDALAEQDLDDCRWIPCFDCGVCPQMGTDIQIGPTGKTLLPLTS
jgi:hypothetical protein